MAIGQSSLAELASRHGWQLPGDPAAVAAVDLDTALRLALHLARLEAPGDLEQWRQALYREGRRRLFPQRFPPPTPEVEEVARHFFPLADAVITSQAQRGGEGIAVRLPFRPLAEAEFTGWPAADEYGRLLVVLEQEGLLVTLAMAQQWLGFSIADHVLGVTGLAIHIARQLARSIPVSLPLLHGAAIGHDVGKFGCVGDEERRIPRLHYYYTHQWYEARGLPGIGHIATNHSCWDLERVRLPVETQLLIYADFRVKDMPGPDGTPRMSMIPLRDAFAAIRDKLENLDRAKLRRYEEVYGKLRDLEDYLLTLGVRLDPPGFEGPARERPRIPAGLDVLEVMAGRTRPDLVALATGGEIPTVARLFSTAHNIGVMERLRNAETMRGLLEEARSSEGWRDLRTYLGVLGEYSPAMSMEQKDLALEFCFELLSHRDDDIRYHASNRIGDLLGLEERFWTKDLPDGVTVEESTWALRRLERVFSLLDQAPAEHEEDMGEVEKELYAIPVILRRLVRRAEPQLRRQVLALVLERIRGRLADERPLVGLYCCESLEVLLPYFDQVKHVELLEIAQAWAHHEAVNTRLMAWRVMLGVAREGLQAPGVKEGVRYCVGLLAANARAEALVAELFLLEELARLADAVPLAERCLELREEGRGAVREVMLRNLKSRVGWVEKKINCDYLLARARGRMARGEDPETHFANEVAFHLANILKVSRVEGARFHAGRCLLELVPQLSVQQRNDLAVELLRSLQLDVEAVTRYIPRFLAAVIATLPEQEFIEILDDIEVDARRGSEALQRLLLQTTGWLLLQMRREQLDRRILRRLAGILMGALAEERASTVHEALAQVAMVLDRLLNKASGDDRLTRLLALTTKQFLALVAHSPGDRGRFFLVASALNHLDHALHRARPRPRFPVRRSVALMPGTFDPFTIGHGEVTTQALKFVDEVLVQVDDYSWRKHAQPRRIRQELAWRALAPLPEAFLSPIEPPINIARRSSLASMFRRLRGRPVKLVVGSDVLEGASAYRSAESAVWDVPHIVIHRPEMASSTWRAKLSLFRAGVEVATVPPRVSAVSSTSVRQALRRREALEAMCDPLVARILSERQLYLNFPSAKETVNVPRLRVEIVAGDHIPAVLSHVARLEALSAGGRRSRGRSETLVLCEGESGRPLAALSWTEVPAAELPVAVNDRRLTPHLDGRLLGRGALITAVAADRPPAECAAITPLLAKAMARWMDAGLLFALFGLPPHDAEALEASLIQAGASWLASPAGDDPGTLRWAAVSLTDPLLLLWDMGFVLQPRYGEAPTVRRVIEENRRAIAAFFGVRHPGAALLQVQEREVKREVAAWARERLARERRKQWVVLGLGTFFVRDLVGEYPTIALELERFLTWEGYEAGTHPAPGSPSLELQLHTARSLGRDALLLAPILIEVEPLLEVAEAARAAGVRLREVLVGLTSASVHATLHLKGIRHRCGTIVPRWRGILRESAVAPFIGGWNILGRSHMQSGSLLPSLNDCLPYHDPHPLGLDREGALDFSRLALELTRRLLESIEELFRATEARFLSLPEMGAVVRTPRCPPLPEGFEPPRDRLPSQLLAEDLRALARLHPETHEAHRIRWSGR